MTPTEALQAVYAKGERCKDCCMCYQVRDDGSTSDFGRSCVLIDNYGRDPEDCPGVEDELNKENANG